MNLGITFIYYIVLLLITLSSFPVYIRAGSCWSNYNPVTGRCVDLLYRNTTRSDCCLRAGFSYTRRMLSYENIFRAIIDDGGVANCIPCTSFGGDVCANIECGRDQTCIPWNRQPRCSCRPDCYPDTSKNPVCGTNGIVYSNVCHLRTRRCRHNLDIEVAYPGPCRNSCKTIQCIEDRVCIEDSEGAPHCINCRPSCTNDELGASVCGLDGNTYESACHLRHASCSSEIFLKKDHNGKCQDSNTCSNFLCMEGRLCTMDYRGNIPRCFPCDLEDCDLDPTRAMGPICGRNNQTYASYCELNRKVCKTRIYMQSKHIGSCSASPLSMDGLESFFRQYISLFKQDMTRISTTQLSNRLGIEEKEVEELLLEDTMDTMREEHDMTTPQEKSIT